MTLRVREEDGKDIYLTNYYGHAIGFAGADKSAVGTINRPLQAFCPRSRCPGYFVNVHNRALRFTREDIDPARLRVLTFTCVYANVRSIQMLFICKY